MKHFFSIAVTFLLAGLLFSCAEVEDPVGSVNTGRNPGKDTTAAQTYTLTVVAAKGEAGKTKALSLSPDGTTLNASWAEGEAVSVYNETTMKALTGSLVAQSSGATTTLDGQLQGGISAGDVLTLKFLSPSYENQEGTLDYIAGHCDYAEASVTVASVQGGRISVTGTANFKNKQAIVKFTLVGADGTTAIRARRLAVTTGITTINVTMTQPQNVIYVALPAIEGRSVRLQAVDADDQNHVYQRTGVTFETGKYYAISVKMSNAIIVTTEEELKAAVANGIYIILGADITLSEYLRIGESVTQEVTLDLNGHTLKRNLSSASSDGHVIEVYTKGTLTVTDGATGGTITGGWANNGGGICNYGTLNFQGGTISECKTTYAAGCMGGGIKNNRGGTVTMSGGTIAHCESGDCGGIYNGEGATLIVTGGTIFDCTSGAGGGGIVNYGTATLSGLTLDSNTAGTRGGNIWNNGSLTIDNCVIKGGQSVIEAGGLYLNGGQTTLTGTKVETNESPDGGGFYVTSGATLILGEGSEITSNVSFDHGGGGITNYGTVTLKDDVTITDNSCETNGGGIWNNGTLNVEGDISIKGNTDGSETLDHKWVPGNRADDVYLKPGRVITVTGELTGGAESIGVRMEKIGVFTSGYDSYDDETNDFFPSGTINGMELENGEGKMYYRYYEASWDGSKVNYEIRNIPEGKEVSNICTASTGIGLDGRLYFFVADGNAELPQGCTCFDDCEVHILLCDDSSLTLKGGLYVNAGSTLHIHCQSYGGAQGKLVVDPKQNSDEDDYNPGIGGRGDGDKATGTIIIHGGDITANGGKYAAGIGGGSDGDNDDSDHRCGTVKIYGGAISATGGEKGAGIGGGYYSAGGTVEVYAGSITAKGGENAAGVGGGESGDACVVTVYDCYSLSAEGGIFGAGIGGGYNGFTGPVKINGGSIDAKGGDYAAGIGSGYNYDQRGAIEIGGGFVRATGGKGAAGIGTGVAEDQDNEIEGGTIIISAGEVVAKGGEVEFPSGKPVIGGGAGIGTGNMAISVGTITISGGKVTATGGSVSDPNPQYYEGQYDGAGIGGGYLCPGGTVDIKGGSVTASGKKAIGAGGNAEGDGNLSLPDGYSVKGGSSSSDATVAATNQRKDFCRKAWSYIWPGD